MKLLPDCQVLKFVEAAGLPHWTVEVPYRVQERDQSSQAKESKPSSVYLNLFLCYCDSFYGRLVTLISQDQSDGIYNSYMYSTGCQEFMAT